MRELEKKRFSRAQKAFVAVLAIISLITLLCNALTDLCVDDFCYLSSFATKERITSFWQIFPSMAAHAKTMNGRVVAHFLVQLFLILPLPIFKILNTAVFVLEIILILRLSGKDVEREWLIALCAFSLVWVYEPAFGQVNFWLDGACNYLWSALAALAFIYPYATLFLQGKEIERIGSKVSFCVLAFFAGAFAESTAITVLFMAVCLLLITRFCGRKIAPCYIFGVAACLLGFLFMISSPAEFENKLSDFKLGTLRVNFIAALEMIKSYWILLLTFVVMAVTVYHLAKEKRTLVLASVLALGGLCANFVHIFAEYYPARCAAFSVVLFVASDIALARKLLETCAHLPLKCAVAALLLVFSYNLCIGVNDVFSTHVKISENEQIIEECREAGIVDVELPMFVTHSKYSAVSGLKYLDTEMYDTWPNNHMAAYYGVNSIIGYWEE